MPWFRTRDAGGRWSAWQPADDDLEAEPRLAPELRHLDRSRRGDPVAHARARLPRPRVPPLEPARVRVGTPAADSPARRRSSRARAGTRTSRSLRKKPKIAPELKLAVVHHTASTNAYSCAQSAVDRARDRGLPREGKRLGRHRLQLPRRRVRPGVRRTLGRHRAQRRRRTLGRVQQGHRRCVDDRQLRTRRLRRRRSRTRSSSCSRGGSTSVTSIRAPRSPSRLGRKRQVPPPARW